MSKFHKKTNTGYYYCSDTSCKGKGYNVFKIDNIRCLYDTIKEEFFKISTEHNIPYEEHTYVIIARY